MVRRYMIDDPGQFADLATWERYLSELREIRPQDDSVRDAMATARETIRRKRQESRAA